MNQNNKINLNININNSKNQNNWLLPEQISDVLAYEANLIEQMRRSILDAIAEYGYEFVIPPLIEYTHTLNLGTHEDLAKKIFKWQDSKSQKMLGVRADITPQIARIDAHVLNTENITRFSYCDSVLQSHTHVYDTRQPMQIGAEIYGCANIAADIEILELMFVALAKARLNILQPKLTLSISHAGLLTALGIDIDKNQDMQALYQALKHKNYASLELESAHPHQHLLLQLIKEHQANKVIEILSEYAKNHDLPKLANITEDFTNLEQAFTQMQAQLGFSQDIQFFVDVSDVESYQYHTGLEFAIYMENHPYAIAKGGRYDRSNQNVNAFGLEKNRAACGFSINLRQISGLHLQYLQSLKNSEDIKNSENSKNAVNNFIIEKKVILAPFAKFIKNNINNKNSELSLQEKIQNLRKNQQAVICLNLEDEQLQKLKSLFEEYLNNNNLNKEDFQNFQEIIKKTAGLEHSTTIQVTGLITFDNFYQI